MKKQILFLFTFIAAIFALSCNNSNRGKSKSDSADTTEITKQPKKPIKNTLLFGTPPAVVVGITFGNGSMCSGDGICQNSSFGSAATLNQTPVLFALITSSSSADSLRMQFNYRVLNDLQPMVAMQFYNYTKQQQPKFMFPTSIALDTVIPGFQDIVDTLQANVPCAISITPSINPGTLLHDIKHNTIVTVTCPLGKAPVN